MPFDGNSSTNFDGRHPLKPGIMRVTHLNNKELVWRELARAARAGSAHRESERLIIQCSDYFVNSETFAMVGRPLFHADPSVFLE
jgi:hypothetical protein